MKQSICRLFIAGIAIVFFANMVHAETRYVTDQMQITFRTGPATDRKILSLLNSGQKVTLIQPEGEWAKVSREDGLEGWVLERYLTTEIPPRIVIREVNHTLDQLKTELGSVQKTNQALNADKTELIKKLTHSRQELAKTKQSFEKLKKAASGFLELKATHDKTVEHLSAQTQKATALDKDLSGLRKKQYIRWFMGGAGVLLVGFIMGFSSKQQKRHSSLL